MLNLRKALAAAIDLAPDRRVILTDSGNFPSDIYMAEGLIRSLGRGHELRVVDPEDVVIQVDQSPAGGPREGQHLVYAEFHKIRVVISTINRRHVDKERCDQDPKTWM